MYEQLGLGVDFQFRHSGQSDINNAISDMNKLYNTAGMTSTELKELGNNFDMFTNQLQSTGLSTMLKGVAISFGAIGGVIKASGYQDIFTGALKYMSDTSEQGIATFNNALSGSAKWLGITKESILDATKEYMAMGLAQDKAIEMAESVSYAGQVWDVLPIQAASAFKGIAAAYNLDFLVKDLRDDFIDMVNQVADYTALTGNDTLNFLSSAGSGLKLIGNTGMEGAMGIAAAARRAEVDVTHLGYGMRTMSKRYASDIGETQFASLGVAIRDANGNLKPFDQALAEVASKMKNIDSNTMTEFATKIGGLYSDDLLRTLSGWQEYDKTMQIINSRDYAGSAQVEWDKITQTFSHSTNVTKVIWADFVQSTFGQLLPVLAKFVGWFNKAFDAITKFLTVHPKLGKLVAGFIGLSGILLVVGGGILFLIGKLSSMSIAMTLASGSTKVMSGAMVGLRGALGTIKPMIGSFIKQVVGMASAFGAVYFLWKYDIFNIRTILESFVSNVKKSFLDSKELISKNAVEIQTTLANMDVSSNFYDKLTAFFTRGQIGWNSLKDMWSDYTISEELYDNLVASGMEPTVTSIMMLVFRARSAWSGFKDGFNEGCKIIKGIITDVLAPPFVWIREKVILPAIEALMDFFIKVGWIDKDSALLKKNSNEWKEIGKQIGTTTAFMVAFLSVMKVFSIITTRLKPIGFVFKTLIKTIMLVGKPIWWLIKLFGAFGGKATFAIQAVAGKAATIGEAFSFVFPKIASFFGGIGKLFGAIKTGAVWVLTAIGTVVTAVLGFFGIVVTLPAWVVGLITAAVVAIIALVIKFRDKIWNGLKWLGSKIKDGVVAVINFFKEIPGAIAGFFEKVWDWINTLPAKIGDALGYAVGMIYLFFTETVPGAIMYLVDVIRNFFTVTIPSFFSFLWDKIVEFGTAIGEFFTVTIPNIFWNCVNTIGDFFTVTIPSFFSFLWNNIVGFGESLWNFVTVDIPSFFESLPEKLFQIGKDIVSGLWDGITSMIEWVGDKVKEFCSGFVGGFKRALGISSPSTVFAEIGTFSMEGLIEGIKGLKDKVFKTVGDLADSIGTKIKKGLSKAKEWGSNMVEGISEGMTSAGDKIKGAANWVIGGISDFLGFSSPAKKGEGRNIVKWGTNMVGGFIDGISNAKGRLDSTIENLITKPNLPMLSANAKINSVNGVDGFDLNANLNIIANATVINQMLANIVYAFADVVKLTGQITKNFIGMNDIIPSSTDVERYANRISMIYDNRIDRSYLATDNGVSVKIDSGAFTINISGISKDNNTIGEELKVFIENSVVDTVRKLKDEQYEM